MATPPWEQRFRAPVSYLPEWSPAAPGHAVYASNESGRWQIHTLDLERGTTRQVTDDPVGLTDAVPTLDGEGVLWFQDETGDESGRWLVQPFARWRHGAVPRRRAARLERRARPGAGDRRRRDLRPRRLRRARLARGRDRPRSSCARPNGSASAASTTAGSCAARCRRTARCSASSTPSTAISSIPPSASSTRAPGDTARRAPRRRHVARCELLVAGLGRPAPRVPARARGRRAPRALESRHGRADESRDRPATARSRSPTGSPTRRRSCW